MARVLRGGTPHDNVHFFQRYLDDPIDPKLVSSAVVADSLSVVDESDTLTLAHVQDAVKLLREANVPAFEGCYSVALHPLAIRDMRSEDTHHRLWRAIWKVSPSSWKCPCDAERVPVGCERTYAEMSALGGRLTLEWRRWERSGYNREAFAPSEKLLRDVGPIGRSAWCAEWDDVRARDLVMRHGL